MSFGYDENDWNDYAKSWEEKNPKRSTELMIEKLEQAEGILSWMRDNFEGPEGTDAVDLEEAISYLETEIDYRLGIAKQTLHDLKRGNEE